MALFLLRSARPQAPFRQPCPQGTSGRVPAGGEMSLTEDSLATELLASDEEFRQLHDEHQYFERRLETLHLKSSLSSEDELEEKSIKRQKLWLKDRMAVILQSQRQVETTA